MNCRYGQNRENYPPTHRKADAYALRDPDGKSGRDAGGDNRCPIAASSLAAFLIVAQPNDDPAAPSLRLDAPLRFSWPSMLWHIVAGYTPDAQLPEPVAHLRQLYDIPADRIITHREVRPRIVEARGLTFTGKETTCPGDALQTLVEALRQ